VVAIAACLAWPALEVARLLGSAGRVYLLGGDQALLELQARRAWHWDLLVGPYSRYGWHHPGPALAYLLALPVRLFEQQGPGLYVGTALINGLAGLVVVAWVWRRRGARAALGASGALCLLDASFGVASLRYPWNPYLIVVPLLAFVVVWADGLGGHLGALAWAAVLASYVAQTDISAALYVVVAEAVAVAACVVRWRRKSPPSGGWVRAPGAALAGWLVFVASWVPSVVELFRDHPNNIRLILGFLKASASEPVPSFRASAHQVLNALTIVPFTYHTIGGPGGSALIARSHTELALGLALLASVSALAIYRSWRLGDLVAGAVVAGSLAAAVFGLATEMRSPLPQLSYIVVWMAFVPAGVAVGAAEVFLGPKVGQIQSPPPGPTTGRGGRALVALCLAGTLVAGAVCVREDLRLPAEWKTNDPVLALFSKAALGYLKPSDHVVDVDMADDAAFPQAAGLVLQLVRSGRSTTVTPARYLFIFGNERRPDRPASVTFTVYDRAKGQLPNPLPGRLLASSGGEWLVASRSQAK